MIQTRRQFLSQTFKSAGRAAALAASDSLRFPQMDLGSNPGDADKDPNTLLFFDDWPLDRRDHVEIRVGHPEWQENATLVHPILDLAWSYPSVFRDSDTGKWLCLYQARDIRLNRSYPLLAESTDGTHWNIPDLSRIVHLPNRTYPNQVLPVAEFSEWSPCFYDERAIAEERLKGLVFSQSGTQSVSYLWVSPDGVHWNRIDGVQWQRDAPDPVTCAFWNRDRLSYVLTTRPSLNDRRIAVMETKDWRTFSEPELALEADALDTSLAQLYGMPVFEYEGYYVGLLWVYHVPPEVVGASVITQKRP